MITDFQPNIRSTDAPQTPGTVFVAATHVAANDNDPGPEFPPPMPPAAALPVHHNRRALPAAA